MVLRPGILLLVAAATLAAQQYRAFWADAFHSGCKTPAQVEQLLDDLAAAKANAIFAQMRPRGNTLFPHPVEPFFQDDEYAPGFDALEYLIERAHARGIEVHAWFNVTNVGTSTDPRHLTAAHGPNAAAGEVWMTVSSAGAVSGTSVDPGHPDAAQYTADVILEPVKRYALDGIHLDYVRYPEGADYGWNPTAVERFARLFNKPGAPSARDAEWSAFRRAQVTQLVREIYLRAFAIRPAVKVSASFVTWGNGPLTDADFLRSDAYSRVFQDWRGWLEQGIVDVGMPMNYFRENDTYAPMFDRWIEFEKDHQYGRAIVAGPAIYLNGFAGSLAQMGRALAPSAAGNRLAGVCLYSYAVTNSTKMLNADFYRAAGEFFGAPADVPALPWKAAPVRGHVYGVLSVDGGPAWLKDGADVAIESDTGTFAVRTTTGGNGFFGATDLPPDRYRVRVERGGRELFRATPQDVGAGKIARFDIRLSAADFAAVVPRIAEAAGRSAGSPGDAIVLNGAGFAAEPAWATAVPLPGALGRTQVMVNGVAAPLFNVAQGRIEMQLPYVEADGWTIVVRHAGLESQPFRLAYAAAAPVILGAGKRTGGWIEIAATGLGAVNPPVAFGGGGNAFEPYNRTVQAVTVLFDDTEVAPDYAGLAPWYPGRYQVNARMPEGWSRGTIRLKVAGQISPVYRVDY